jgi:hypothetical protein
MIIRAYTIMSATFIHGFQRSPLQHVSAQVSEKVRAN